MKKPKLKPTGVTGPVRISQEGASFRPVVFPKTKEEIEHFIVQGFVSNFCKEALSILSFEQNEQNDFDFTLQTNLGQKYLELMEIAPLEKIRGSYADAPSSYNAYEFAQTILAKILSKSSRYTGLKTPPVMLLLYVTDWAFTLSETVNALLQYWLIKNKHAFQCVFAFKPRSENSGTVSILFPTPPDFWAGFDPERARNTIVHNISSQSAQRQ